MGVRDFYLIVIVIVALVIDYIRRKKIKEMFICDSQFGILCFKRNRYNESCNDLVCYDKRIRFGNYNPTIQIKNYKKDNHKLYVKALNYVYEIQNEIIESLCKEIRSYSNSWNLRDKDSNLITYEYIKENFNVDTIIISIEAGEIIAAIKAWCDGVIEDQDIAMCIIAQKRNSKIFY